MLDQTTDFNNEETSVWKEKKEVMKRLAEALKNTSPPVVNKNANTSPPSVSQKICSWLRKLKTKIWGG